MSKRFLICLLFTAWLIPDCSGSKETPLIQTATHIPDQATPAPTTLPSTPTPTETTVIQPQPGASIGGSVILGDQEHSAILTFQVAEDGASISNFILMLLDLKCGEIYTDFINLEATGILPIDAGTFKGEIPSIGEIEGNFTSPTSAQGQIHLVIDPGLGSKPIQCGTAEFSLEDMTAELTPIPPERIPGPPPTSLPPLLTPVALPSGDVAVVNVYSTEDDEYVYLLGEVENNTPDFITNIRLTSIVYDSAGIQLAEIVEQAKVDELGPGERSPFIITLPRPDSAASFTLNVDSDPGGSAPPDKLRIVDQMVDYNYFGFLETNAIVENGTSDYLQYVMVVSVFYDAEGRVIGVGSNFSAGPDNILAPGKRAPVIVPPQPFHANTMLFADYRLIIANNHSIVATIPPEFVISPVEAEPGILSGSVRFPTQGQISQPALWAATFDNQGKLLEVSYAYIEPYNNGSDWSGAFKIYLHYEDYATYELFTEYVFE